MSQYRLRPSWIKIPAFFLSSGIDKYESRVICALCGAVNDALAVADLLFTNYQVPQDQIHILTNELASRSGIILAPDELSTDPCIQPGDPILFYFTGHGSEIVPPIGWECNSPGRKSQVLLPQNYCSRPGLEIPVIPDYTIACLLEKIAHSKGDNITVILDCFHASSETRLDDDRRDSVSIRSVELDPSIHPNPLDVDIRDERALRSGLASHVLLATCNSSELAREHNGRGAFTTKLLQLLQAVDPNKIS